jgi:hypothetical protein
MSEPTTTTKLAAAEKWVREFLSHEYRHGMHIDVLMREYDLMKAALAELEESRGDYRRLSKEHDQLKEALGLARNEYGGKPIAELDEYDRLRLTANGFQAMHGALGLTVSRLRADLARALLVVEAAKALVEHDRAKPALGKSIIDWRARRRLLLETLAREVGNV